MDGVEPTLRAGLLARGLELARELPVGAFRRRFARLIDELRATTLVERHAEAVARRRVVIEPDVDGMAWLHLLAPAVEVHAIHSRITAIGKHLRARQDDVDDRCLDQVRADVVCDLLIDGSSSGHDLPAHGIRASVVVTVPALALLDRESPMSAAGGCAEVEGLGPIPLSTARELCGGSGGWMRVLTHPETGAVLSVGRDRYQPPPELAKPVKWRAERCMAPGCGMPASRCQLDHSVAWEHGGPTSLQNLAPLCQGHHTSKHHGGWTIRQFEDGSIRWSSPAGRRYVVAPERPVPVFRSSTPDRGPVRPTPDRSQGRGDPPPF